jgi:uncharacterized protein (TIGR00251 family)
MSWIRETPEGVLVSLLIQPRASKNQISGLQGDRLKVRLTAPPVEGAANKLCIAFLAKCLKVSKSNIDIVSGQSSRQKKVLVRGARLEAVRDILEKSV